jgi:transcription elongation factor Elf1
MNNEMSELIQNSRCINCRNVFIIALKIKEEVKKINVTCPYCGKVGEVNGTELIKITKG